MELSGQLITRLVQQVSDMTINNSFDKFTSWKMSLRIYNLIIKR
jgi:hypothetical protein